jgi:hypothetical protein
MFNDPLPSNGHGPDHVENISYNTYYIVAFLYFGLCLVMGLHVVVLMAGNKSYKTMVSSGRIFKLHFLIVFCSGADIQT